MYEIQFRKNCLEDNGHPLVSGLKTLEEARSARSVSGDLVIDSETKGIVVSDEWLWAWEKENSYAKRAQNQQLKLNLRDAEIPEHLKNRPGKECEWGLCWVWSHQGFEREAILTRVDFDDQNKEKPYQVCIAGEHVSFYYARNRRFGHPVSVGRMTEDICRLYSGRVA